MPEEGRSSDPLNLPRASTATSLELRRETGLSTLLFPPEVATATADDEVHFRDLWHVVVKRKWSILAVFLIVVVATAIGTLMQTPSYRAEMTLRIDQNPMLAGARSDVTLKPAPVRRLSTRTS